MTKSEKWDDNPESREMWRSFLFALLGTLCAGVIFIAIHKYTTVFAGILFLLLGVAAYVFYVFFVDVKKHCRLHLLSVLGACVIGMAIVQFVDTMLVYAPQMDSYVLYGKENMNLFEKAFRIYAFDSRQMLIVFVSGVLLSFLGAGLSYLLFSVLLKKKYHTHSKHR